MATIGTVAQEETQAAPRFKLGYRPWLDGIRAFLIVEVIGYHLRNDLDLNIPLVGGGAVITIEVFFVLSGFLITVLLLEEVQKTKTISLKNFYMRRVRRLIPALVILLVGIGVLSLLGLHDLPRRRTALDILAVAAYVGNWVRSFTHNDLGVLGTTWSLSIEEQFYLLWPLFLLWLIKRGTSMARIAVLLVVGAGASMLWREVLWRITSSSLAVNRTYNGLDTRGYALLLGCAAGVVMHAGLQPRGRVWQIARSILGWLAGFYLLTFIAAAQHYPRGDFVYLNLAAVATAMFIIHMVSIGPTIVHKILEWTPFVAIGRISYGLYLYHYPVITLLTPKRTHLHGWGLAALDCAVIAGAAVASWFIVERRFLRRRTGAKAPAPAS